MGITRYSGDFNKKLEKERQEKAEKKRLRLEKQEREGLLGSRVNNREKSPYEETASGKELEASKEKENVNDEEFLFNYDQEAHNRQIEEEIENASGIGGFMSRARDRIDRQKNDISDLFKYVKEHDAMHNTKVKGEQREDPDWSEFKKGYGKAYFSVIIAAIPGIVFFVVMSVLSLGYGIFLVFPPALSLLSWLIGAYYTASLAAIPIVLFVRWYSFKRFRGTYLLFKENEIIYHKKTVDEQDVNGKIEVYEEYVIRMINPQYEETQGYFKCRGVVEKTEYINGKARKPEIRGQINLPKIFKNMEMIHDYAPDPEINFEKLFEWGFEF